MWANRFVLALAAWLAASHSLSAQGVRVPVPYDGQLRTDPDVGNVQGIQRYGRPLKTDPDQGEGYSYHVYPVAQQNAVGYYGQEQLPAPSRPASAFVQRSSDTPIGIAGQPSPASSRTPEQLRALIAEANKNRTDPNLDDMTRANWNRNFIQLTAELEAIERSGTATAPAPTQSANRMLQSNTYDSQPAWGSPYPAPFDWTSGIRNYAVPVPLPGSSDEIVQRGLTYTRGQQGILGTDIPHQPLIQVKMRVVEVVRGDSLAAGTILEYVSNNNGNPTLTTGQTANTGGENVRSFSRLLVPGLATTAGAGTGSLFNLTSEHINALVQLLATEAKADVVTAPEVVTLNGQNVEFVAGAKVPFELGQNVIQGDSNSIQKFFYKHVGTMVSVTPRIVNWGYYGEGQGKKPILAQDILHWGKLAEWMIRSKIDTSKYQEATTAIARYGKSPNEYALIPFSAQAILLQALNDYASDAVQLRAIGPMNEALVAEGIMAQPACEGCSNWRAQDCTIDLTVVVRLSDKGNVEIDLDDDDETKLTANTEDNIRAISNVIQVKSGHGVVMAGLIGNRETQELAKVPVIGDVPLIGALFRNKVVVRQKTEVLVFIEAKVLDAEPNVARAQSGDDFVLSQPFVAGELLDNPLEYGFCRVGFGTYLPPHTCGEQIYWERFGRDVRNACTHVDDILK
jgi:hypothetical protein